VLILPKTIRLRQLSRRPLQRPTALRLCSTHVATPEVSPHILVSFTHKLNPIRWGSQEKAEYPYTVRAGLVIERIPPVMPPLEPWEEEYEAWKLERQNRKRLEVPQAFFDPYGEFDAQADKEVTPTTTPQTHPQLQRSQ
jgi:hypothetical protein